MKLLPGKFIAPTALCLLLAGCAQTGPPLPPSLELPKPPADLRASRKGNRVTLSWSEPTLTTDRQSVRYLGPTLICRSLETEIAACGNPAAILPAPSPSAAPKKSRRAAKKSAAPLAASQTYTDTLPATLQQQDPSAEFTYAVEILNRNARGGGLSNRVHVPAVVTLPPPSDLAAQLTGDGTVLTWTSTGESQNLPTNSPANIPANSPGRSTSLSNLSARRKLRQRRDCRRGPSPSSIDRAWSGSFHRLQLRMGKDLPLSRHCREHHQTPRQPKCRLRETTLRRCASSPMMSSPLPSPPGCRRHTPAKDKNHLSISFGRRSRVPISPDTTFIAPQRMESQSSRWSS